MTDEELQAIKERRVNLPAAVFPSGRNALILADLDALLAEVERLRATLEWFANMGNWEWTYGTRPVWNNPINVPWDTARKILDK